MLVELGLSGVLGHSVKVREEVSLEARLAGGPFRVGLLGAPEQVVDQRLRMNLLLDE